MDKNCVSHVQTCSSELLTYFDELFADLPTEDAGVLLLVVVDPFFDLRRGHAGLRASDDSGPDGSCLLVAVKDLGHTAMADAQLSANDTRPHPSGGHFDDLQSDMVG